MCALSPRTRRADHIWVAPVRARHSARCHDARQEFGMPFGTRATSFGEVLGGVPGGRFTAGAVGVDAPAFVERSRLAFPDSPSRACRRVDAPAFVGVPVDRPPCRPRTATIWDAPAVLAPARRLRVTKNSERGSRFAGRLVRRRGRSGAFSQLRRFARAFDHGLARTRARVDEFGGEPHERLRRQRPGVGMLHADVDATVGA